MTTRNFSDFMDAVAKAIRYIEDAASIAQGDENTMGFLYDMYGALAEDNTVHAVCKCVAKNI